jgi:hypothetical protein
MFENSEYPTRFSKYAEMVHNVFTHRAVTQRIKSMKKRTRITILLTVTLILFGIACLFSACATKSAIVGAWRLIEAEDPTYSLGMIFEFNDNGALNLLPGVAVLTEEEIRMFVDLKDRLALSYQADRNGNLRITLVKTEGGSAVLRMTYAIEGDILTITDENNVTLTFRQQ